MTDDFEPYELEPSPHIEAQLEKIQDLWTEVLTDAFMNFDSPNYVANVGMCGGVISQMFQLIAMMGCLGQPRAAEMTLASIYSCSQMGLREAMPGFLATLPADYRKAIDAAPKLTDAELDKIYTYSVNAFKAGLKAA